MATIEKGLLQMRSASLASGTTTPVVPRGTRRAHSMSSHSLSANRDLEGIQPTRRQASTTKDDDWVSHLVNSEVGDSTDEFYSVYKAQILVKCLSELKGGIKTESLQHDLESVWKRLYQTVLPTVDMILHPIKTKGLSVRECTLVGFRDQIVLQCGLEEIIQQVKLVANPGIRQMLLVLQSVMECYPPNDNFVRIERILGHLLPQYLGYLGLYQEGGIPVILSKHQEINRPLSKERANSESRVMDNHTSSGGTSARELKHFRQTSTPSNLSQLTHITYLAPVAEQRQRPGRVPSPTTTQSYSGRLKAV